MKQFIVYEIRYDNGTGAGQYYIGKTNRREWSKGYWGNGTVIKRKIAAARRNGDFHNWHRRIIMEFDDEQKAYDLEAYLVNEITLSDPLCLNLRTGGDGGFKPSRETIAKWKESYEGYSHSAETRRNMSKAQKGRKFSADTLRKMSEAKKGKKLTPEHRAKIGEAGRGRKASAETRRKLSEVIKRRPPPTVETRKRMSEAQKGNKNALKRRKAN